MESKATAKFVRLSPRKVRLVVDAIRGKYAVDALNLLKFTPNRAADEVANVLRSAVANAVTNHGMADDYLKVAACYVDAGPTLKRVQPRAQGRAYRILKRTSHITVVVTEGVAPAIKTGPTKIKKAPLLAAKPLPTAVAPVEEETAGPVAAVETETPQAEGQE
jgi:large subunit ribosomal protein L22